MIQKKHGANVGAGKPDQAPPRWLRLRRPRLAAGVAGGVLVYALLFLFTSLPGRLGFVLSWDACVLIAMILLAGLRDTQPNALKRIAAQQDAGKWTVLFLTLVAASASLIAIAGEVPLIKNAAEFEKIVRIALIVATIILSWSFIHVIFALHYAHDYYSSDDGGATTEGLAFPGKTAPTYMDFVYFSFTIGMTFQVSDVQITDPVMRTLALTHGIISFFYSTGILALTINLVAGVI